MTGTLKIFAALARPITLLKRSWRSIDMTPKVICGWWSMKMTVQFSGVSRLWIWLLAGIALSFHSGLLESISMQDGGAATREDHVSGITRLRVPLRQVEPREHLFQPGS